MKIAIASDHAGFDYKRVITEHLQEIGHEVVDFGTYSDEKCDYPDFVIPAAKAVAADECDRAVVLGGSGNGEAIAANRVIGVRCALCWNIETAVLARQHNDANAISIGQRMLNQQDVLAIIDQWLVTPFEGGRHLARIQKLDDMVSNAPA
ncbi:ribose 5-phosphate isomerase B [Calycomorphotria hydatis]|uniref:Ribose-5-phosphate isomerase B n=1 Tax=Calycomorphotria hydatis TaxID=2528027 RepID=A0A517T9J0_9PLAN|nr:Ribose-5-phosphate isomerase B [Calycomorphotria hydatis]